MKNDRAKNIIGDWGLGIGDWAQSPIPNPQSPFIIISIKMFLKLKVKLLTYIYYK